MVAAGLETTEPLEEAGEEPEALEAVKMLLDLGADINAVDSNGDTAAGSVNIDVDDDTPLNNAATFAKFRPIPVNFAKGAFRNRYLNRRTH